MKLIIILIKNKLKKLSIVKPLNKLLLLSLLFIKVTYLRII